MSVIIKLKPLYLSMPGHFAVSGFTLYITSATSASTVVRPPSAVAGGLSATLAGP